MSLRFYALKAQILWQRFYRSKKLIKGLQLMGHISEVLQHPLPNKLFTCTSFLHCPLVLSLYSILAYFSSILFHYFPMCYFKSACASFRFCLNVLCKALGLLLRGDEILQIYLSTLNQLISTKPFVSSNCCALRVILNSEVLGFFISVV